MTTQQFSPIPLRAANDRSASDEGDRPDAAKRRRWPTDGIAAPRTGPQRAALAAIDGRKSRGADETEAQHDSEEQEWRRLPRGIAIGVLSGVVIWALLVAAAVLLFR